MLRRMACVHRVPAGSAGGRREGVRQGWMRRSVGSAALALVLVVVGAVTASAEVSLVSWKPVSDLAVRSTANTRAEAQAEAVRWVVGERLLFKDVGDLWHPELDQELFSRPERFISSIEGRRDGYYLTINMVEVIRSLVTVFFGTITPRVAVVTDEVVILRPPPPDPAVQTAVTEWMLKYGFQVVDPEMVLRSLGRERLFQREGGDPDTMRMAAEELQADIFVTGESFAEQHFDRRGFSARVEYRVIEGATGRVLAAFANTYDVKDCNSELVAAKLALQRGAEENSLAVIRAILNAYGQPVTRVRILRARSFTEANAIRRYLQQAVPGSVVRMEQMRVKGTQYMVLSVHSKMDTFQIAEVLEDCDTARIRVTTVECRNIVCELQ